MSLFGCKRCERAEQMAANEAREAHALRAFSTAAEATIKGLREDLEFQRKQNLELIKRLGEAVAPGSGHRMLATDAMAERVQAEREARVEAAKRARAEEADSKEPLSERLIRKANAAKEGVEIPLPGHEYRGPDRGILRDGGIFESQGPDETDRLAEVVRKRRVAEAARKREQAAIEAAAQVDAGFRGAPSQHSTEFFDVKNDRARGGVMVGVASGGRVVVERPVSFTTDTPSPEDGPIEGAPDLEVHE